MQYVPVAAAVGAGGYVGYRAGSSVRAAMPAKRQRLNGGGHRALGPNRQGFRRKIQRSRFGKVPRPLVVFFESWLLSLFWLKPKRFRNRVPRC